MSDAALDLSFSSPMNRHVRHVVRLTRGAEFGAALGAGGHPDEVPEQQRHLTAPHAAEFILSAAAPPDDFVRRAAEEGFQAPDEHVRLLLDSAAEAICEIDRGGICTFANPACAKLLGYADPGLLLGKNLHALTHSRHLDGTPFPEAECAIHCNYCEQTGAHVEEDVFWRADGSSFYAECRSLPVRLGDRVFGAVITFLDVTDRRQLEEQLRRSQKLQAVGQLVGGIAHDFNNFLTAIKIYNELLAASLGSNVPAQQLLQEIKSATERSASLTRRLLAFGGKPASPPQMLCLNEVVTNSQRLLCRVLGDDICLTAALEPRLEKVMADPEQLERVLLNLVVNARQAMPHGGKIAIESANVVVDDAGQSERLGVPMGRYVMLSVSDTGVGMSQEIKRRIFEPYFTTKGPGEGTGLGLSVVQGIVKQLNGRIAIESEPDCGACFKIFLPCAEPPAALLDPEPNSAPQSPGAETVLFVDREEQHRKTTCQRLRQFGLNPLEASNVNEALLVSSRGDESISMLVTGDSISPAESEMLAERLHALRPELKTLSVSSSPDEPSLRGDAAHELAAPHIKPPAAAAPGEPIRLPLKRCPAQRGTMAIPNWLESMRLRNDLARLREQELKAALSANGAIAKKLIERSKWLRTIWPPQ